jgi:mono/diheme cytochrome c family protein
MKSAIASLAALAFIAGVHFAQAQEMGDARAGKTYAERVCSECHAVRAGQSLSPHNRAPSFQTVANAPGMTSTALRVWFQSPHPSMPNLLLTGEQSDDLVAYILSLRKR